jgi:PAS domain S-box-containing protein
MKDENKTKEQLINELAEMRQRIAELEASETERKRAEEALTEERNLLRTLIDNLPDYIYVKDTESRFVLGNIAAVREVGATTPDEMLGKTDFDFFPEELAAQYYADEQALFRSGQPLVNRGEPVIDHAGNRLWVLTTKVPLRDSRGQIVGLVGMNRDITERKQVEEALQKSEERFRRLSEASFEGILIHEEGKVIDANQAFATMLGYDLSEVIGRNALDFATPELREVAVRHMRTGSEVLMGVWLSARTALRFPLKSRVGISPTKSGPFG